MRATTPPSDDRTHPLYTLVVRFFTFFRLMSAVATVPVTKILCFDAQTEQGKELAFSVTQSNSKFDAVQERLLSTQPAETQPVACV